MNRDTVFVIAMGFAFTVIATTISLAVTYISFAIDPVMEQSDSYMMSLLLPLLLTPVFSYVGFSATLRAKRLARENHRLANVDELTSLSNRRAFFRKAEQLANVDMAERPVFVCAIADIDNFKRVNDTYGHDGGDEVLRVVASVLTAMEDDTVVVARLGGEEFAMAGLFETRERAQAFCQSLVAAVAAKPVTLDGKTQQVTVSLGYAVSGAERSISGLLNQADQALYRAKTAGKNRALEHHHDREHDQGVPALLARTGQVAV